jgi:hypothetical protein
MATLPHTFQVPGGNPVTIYGETANINYFLNNELDPDTQDGVTNEQVSVSAHSRQQYPGDPIPSNVSGSTREYLVDPSRKSGNALPGRQFILKAMNGQGVVIEQRAFTYKGRWLDLHTFLSAEVKYDTYAYNSTGARSTLASTVAP